MKRSEQKLNSAAPRRSARYDAEPCVEVPTFRIGNVNAGSKGAFTTRSGLVLARPANTCNPTRLVAAGLHGLGQSARSPVVPHGSLQRRFCPTTSSLQPWNRGRVPRNNPANRVRNTGYIEYNMFIYNNLSVDYSWLYCKLVATAPWGSPSSSSWSWSSVWVVSITITRTTTRTMRSGFSERLRSAEMGVEAVPADQRPLALAA